MTFLKGGIAVDKDLKLPESSMIQKIFSRAENIQEPVADVIDAEYPKFLPVKAKIIQLYGLYQKYKQQNNLMDYDDLLINFNKLLEIDVVRQQLNNRYPYILVDEYQDINILQHQIILKLVWTNGRVTAVGDDNQSIYGFRGADVNYFRKFVDHFPAAQIVKLERNYRSTQEILDVANQVIRRGSTLDKNLWNDVKGEKVDQV